MDVWSWIEASWRGARGARLDRRALLAGEDVNMRSALRPVLAKLAENYRAVYGPVAAAYSRQFEAAVAALDRPELARRLGLRGAALRDACATIVLLGKSHYDAVLADGGSARRSVRLQGASRLHERLWRRRFRSPYVSGEDVARSLARVDDAEARLARALRIDKRGRRPACRVDFPSLDARELAEVLDRLAHRASRAHGLRTGDRL